MLPLLLGVWRRRLHRRLDSESASDSSDTDNSDNIDLKPSSSKRKCEVNDIASMASTASTSMNSTHLFGVLSSLNAQRTNNPKLCDVMLKMADGNLHCHKAVLVTCSKYFEAMFSHDMMLENVEGKIDLPQFSTDVMDSLLNFIYIGEIGAIITSNDICKRLQAAQYFQIDGAVEKYCHYMHEKLLSRYNYAYFLNMVSKLCLRDAETKICNYIQSELSPGFAGCTSVQYQKLNFWHLRKILDPANDLPNIESEYDIYKLIMMWLVADPRVRASCAAILMNDCYRIRLRFVDKGQASLLKKDVKTNESESESESSRAESDSEPESDSDSNRSEFEEEIIE